MASVWRQLAPWAFAAASAAAAAFWFEMVRLFANARAAFFPEARWASIQLDERAAWQLLAGGAAALLALRGAAWTTRWFRRRPLAGPAPEWPLLLLLPAHAAALSASRGAAPWPQLSPWVFAAALAGYFALWLRRAGFLGDGVDAHAGKRRWFAATLLAAAAFAAVFGALGVLQHEALLVPHGDAGMYHEHLWNFWHGKGFRSQLDSGRLFLGEHIEAIHLLLSPVYLLWPGLPALNLCQAAGLAAGAIAVHLLARRLGLAPLPSFAAAAAYLLYFPLQNLAHEPTWKTFRPETLGVPLLLFALWALEAGRVRTMAACFLLAFLAKEEFAIAAAATAPALWFRGRRAAALWTAGLSVLYLALALGVAIPYFRAGQAPHYTPYFRGLGDSPRAILHRVLTDPAEVWRRVTTGESLGFAATMLAPWLFLPLLSPWRLFAAAPIFGYLMLSDLPELRQPWFHFHAPLAPLLAWAFVGGLAKLPPPRAARLAVFAAAFGLLLSVWFGRGPLSWAFHDPHFGVPRTANGFSPTGSYWRDLYLPNDRSRAFEEVLAAVPASDRVAATDYVRTRFVRHAAAHDYPLRPHVGIADVDCFVLDKMEGWWGRGRRTNPDHGLLAAAAQQVPAGTRIMVRDVPFVAVRSTPFFLAARRADLAAPPP